MKTQSRDTNPKVEQVQIELLRRAGPARRAALACSLSDTTITLARRAIREANPRASEDDLKVLFVRIHYGDALAKHLADDLRRRRA